METELNSPVFLALDDWIFNWQWESSFVMKSTELTEPVTNVYAYFNYMTGKGVQKEFKRYAYTISDRASNLTLIHYKGDDSIVNENPHVRTCLVQC